MDTFIFGVVKLLINSFCVIALCYAIYKMGVFVKYLWAHRHIKLSALIETMIMIIFAGAVVMPAFTIYEVFMQLDISLLWLIVLDFLTVAFICFIPYWAKALLIIILWIVSLILSYCYMTIGFFTFLLILYIVSAIIFVVEHFRPSKDE